MDGMDRIQSQAFDVILRGAADAFDLSQESSKTIARYDTAGLVRPGVRQQEVVGELADYIDHGKTLGKLLLLARRLCESGCGFVMVNTGFVWDMHGVAGVHAGVEEGMRYVAPPLDHAVSAFLDDVEARGLSDKILLVMCGEMGRTPKIEQAGRPQSLGEPGAAGPGRRRLADGPGHRPIDRQRRRARRQPGPQAATSSARSCTRCSTSPSFASAPTPPALWPSLSPKVEPIKSLMG